MSYSRKKVSVYILVIVGIILASSLFGCGKEETPSRKEEGSAQKEESSIQKENNSAQKEEFLDLGIEIKYHATEGEFIANPYARDVPALETVDSAREKGKTILTFTTVSVKGFDSNFRRVVNLFNNQSDEYYVDLINCYTGDELDSMMRRLNLEFASGGGPDIFQETVFPIGVEHLEKGMVVDLTPYLEQSGITKETFFPAYASYVYQDRIYGVTTSVSLSCDAIKEEVLGSRECSDIDTLLDKLLAYPEKASLFFPNQAPYAIVANLLGTSETLWGAVDWKNKTCDFSKPTFSKVLDVAKRYSEDAKRGYDAVMHSYYLGMSNIGVMDYDKQDDVMIGSFYDDGCFPSYGSAEVIMINANTKHLEGAYAFVSFLMTKTPQSYMFEPVNKEVWEEMYQNNMKKMEDGGFPGVLNDDIKKQLLEMYEKGHYEPRRNQVVLDIVFEEMDAFFTDQKTKEEVIDIIQRRVQMYLSE